MFVETVKLGERELTLETGRLARQASGACLARTGDTMVLATAVAAEEPRPGMGFFPLTVEYRERYAAVGLIPPWQNRREGRPSDDEILTSRIIDRSIRPLFPKGFLCEVQVIVTVLSAEPDIEPGPLALIAASTALHLSDIPWAGPVAGARFVRGKGGVAPFPDLATRRAPTFDLVVAVGPDGLLMVEGETDESAESELAEALFRAGDMLEPVRAAQERLRDKAGRAKRGFVPPERPADVDAAVATLAGEVREALQIPAKHERSAALKALRGKAEALVAEQLPEAAPESVRPAFDALSKSLARENILAGRRADGRSADQVRPITIEAGLIPGSHGSAVFTRGETQALATATLGHEGDRMRVNDPFGERKSRFLLHYNFPPFSVGEVRPLRGVGRREIGHGNLAHRALARVVPSADAFPYVLRVVSDILESNGSSSMATTCAGCLALMDAGVPLKKPVAGVAMGLVQEGERVAVLTDILGDEDHLGDMDFKVCGTAEGVTAVQMDIKIQGLDRPLLVRALEQAREARLHILGEMAKVLPAPREKLAPNAPRIYAHRVRPERIRDVIGSGGSTIRGIMEETGARLDVNDDGLVLISGSDEASARAALARVQRITAEAEVGAFYEGIVKGLRDRLAFIEILPGTDGGLHISELDNDFVSSMADRLSQGDRVVVKVLGVDERGRIRLSRKQALDADPTDVKQMV